MSEPFSDTITIYTGTDWQEEYFLEDIEVAIAVIIPGNPTTINTAIPHELTTGGFVNIRGVENAIALNGTFAVTVTDIDAFTVPVNTTGYAPSGGTASKPVDISGWVFAGEIRTSTSDPRYPNLTASVANGSKQILLEGKHTLEEGDEITIAGSGINSSAIVAIYKDASSNERSVAIVSTLATAAVERSQVSRTSRLIASLQFTVNNPAQGRFIAGLPQSITASIAPPVPGTDEKYLFDIKYKSNNVVSPLIKGGAIVIPMSTQVTL